MGFAVFQIRFSGGMNNNVRPQLRKNLHQPLGIPQRLGVYFKTEKE